VEAAYDHDLLLDQAIEDAVRKTPQQESSYVFVDDRCSERVGSDHLQTRPERCQELFPKARALILVPPIRPFDTGGGGRSKDR
jgi:hypothetical protein